MQKHAFIDDIKQYETLYDPLPTEDSVALYYDKEAVALPYSDSFPKQHYHNRYEIGICLSGDGLFLSEGKYASVSKGDIIFISPKSRHYSRSLDKNEPCLCRFLYYKTERIAKLLDKTDEQDFLNTVSKIPTVIREREFLNAHSAFKKLTDIVLGEHSQKGLLVGLHLSALILEANDWFSGGKNHHKASVPSIRKQSIKEVAEYISLHYNENITAKQLTRICHLSESQLRRQFIAAFGMPPTKYRNQLRSDIAAELLKRSEQSIAEISDSLGYNSTSDFYRMFKKFYGVSPSKYRKSNTM